MQGRNLTHAPGSGARLVGVVVPDNPDNGEGNPAGSEPTLLLVERFRGDVAEGALWDSGSEVWQEAYFHPQELVGAHWNEEICDSQSCITVTYRIASVARDESQSTMPEHSDNSDIWLYEVHYFTGQDDQAWANACREGENGEIARGLFVEGQWSADGERTEGGYTFSCPNGVIAKCARSWGYAPWRTLEADDGRAVSLQPLHQACTRAARADYCGDGISRTKDGTVIDMFDRYSFNVRERGSGLQREAWFDENGATGMIRERWAGDPDIPGVSRECRRQVNRRGHRKAALLGVWSSTAR